LRPGLVERPASPLDLLDHPPPLVEREPSLVLAQQAGFAGGVELVIVLPRPRQITLHDDVEVEVPPLDRSVSDPVSRAHEGPLQVHVPAEELPVRVPEQPDRVEGTGKVEGQDVIPDRPLLEWL